MSLRRAATVAASVCPHKQAPVVLPDAGAHQTKSPARLRKRAEFLAMRRGEKRRGPFFLLEVLDRKDDGAPRAGFTVTRKVGNAVVRNRVRRRLREAVRVKAAVDMLAGHDYVVVGRQEVLGARFAALADDLSRRIGAVRPATRP